MASGATRFVSYWSLMGLSAQTGRWQSSTNVNLIQMTALLEESSSLLVTAGESDAASTASQEEATSLGARATEVKAEASALRSQAKTDTAEAASLQTEADTTQVEAATVAEEGATHTAAAAGQEAASDANFVDGMADATEAARIEARAHGEELGVAFCELIPILDLACDVLGGVSAVAMEAGAAAEAVKASAELAAAAAAKAEEEREVALATELYMQSAEDEAAAAKLEQEAGERAEEAEEELALATEKENAAKTLFEEAETEGDLAADEEAKAVENRTQSARLAAQAAMKGVDACSNAILAGMCGLVSFVYFLFKAFTTFLIPGTRRAIAGMKRVTAPGAINNGTWRSLGRDASYCFHHFAIFVLVAFIFQTLLSNLSHNSLKARGGILLCFAFSASAIQATCLHFLPGLVARVDSAWVSTIDFVRRMLSFPLLFTMEILLLWVIFGARIFSFAVSQLVLPLLVVFTALMLGLHLLLLEIPTLQARRHRSKSLINDNELHVYQPKGGEQAILKDDQKEASECDTLLPKSSMPVACAVSELPEDPSWLSILWKDLLLLQPLFEALILSCLARIMINSLNSIRILWPAAKMALIHSRPPWLLPVTVSVTLTLSLLCILSCLYG